MERQSSFGCYHPEAAGLLPNDVHVIDLRDRSTDKTRVERSTNEQLPEVVVELGPELTEGKDSNNLLLSKKVFELLLVTNLQIVQIHLTLKI